MLVLAINLFMNLSIFIELFSNSKSASLILNPKDFMLPAFHPYHGESRRFSQPAFKKVRLEDSAVAEGGVLENAGKWGGMTPTGFLLPRYGGGKPLLPFLPSLPGHPSSKEMGTPGQGGRFHLHQHRARRKRRAPRTTRRPTNPVADAGAWDVAQNSRCRRKSPRAGDWFRRTNPTGDEVFAGATPRGCPSSGRAQAALRHH